MSAWNRYERLCRVADTGYVENKPTDIPVRVLPLLQLPCPLKTLLDSFNHFVASEMPLYQKCPTLQYGLPADHPKTYRNNWGGFSHIRAKIFLSLALKRKVEWLGQCATIRTAGFSL